MQNEHYECETLYRIYTPDGVLTGPAIDTREGSHKSPEMTWLKLSTKLTEH